MRYRFTEVSRNEKTGPIPVVTVSRKTCPTSCPLMKNGCYAESGPLKMVWDQVTDETHGTDLEGLCDRLQKLPKKQLWRYGQAGDLPGEGDTIDPVDMEKLVRANRGRPVIAYTHKPPTQDNLDTLKMAREGGFHVNLSADNMMEADELASTGFNTVVVLHQHYARKTRKGEWAESLTEYKTRTKNLPRRTPMGRKIAICPATYHEVRCSDCGVCADAGDRKAIVGFPAHGTSSRKISNRLNQ